jgi:hypothetical protein
MTEASDSANTSTTTAGTPAGRAHYVRVLAPINNESLFGQSVREPDNRHNAYYSPGEQANLPTGLLTSDCGNTGNASQVPLPVLSSGNVPCKLQPTYPWGKIAPTTPNSYFPHLTRSPLPK